MAEQLEITGRRAVGRGQRIGIELAAHLHAGFAAELLQQALVAHVFDKHRADFFGFHLAHQLGHGFGRGFGVGGDALRGQKADLIALRQVAKGVVAGQHLALAGRDGGKALAGVGVQRVQLLAVLAGALAVVVLAGRVGLGERGADIVDVEFDVLRVVPGVRVGVAVVVAVMIVFFFGHVLRLHALAGHHGLALEAGRFAQPAQPAFKAQAVDHKHLGGGQFFDILRRGLKHMGVLIGADQAGHVHPLAAHFAGEVGQNAEAGEHRQFVGQRRRGQQRQQQGDQGFFHACVLG